VVLAKSEVDESECERYNLSVPHNKFAMIKLALARVMGGGTGSVLSLLPSEKATGNVKVVQRMPLCIDFDHSARQDFNAEGLLKPGLSIEPGVRAR
jgi:hypothetical protein